MVVGVSGLRAQAPVPQHPQLLAAVRPMTGQLRALHDELQSALKENGAISQLQVSNMQAKFLMKLVWAADITEKLGSFLETVDVSPSSQTSTAALQQVEALMVEIRQGNERLQSWLPSLSVPEQTAIAKVDLVTRWRGILELNASVYQARPRMSWGAELSQHVTNWFLSH